MNRNIIFIGIAILLLVGLGSLYFYSNPIGSALSYTTIETGDRQHRETGDYYTIQINYPDKTPLAARGSVGAEIRAQAAIAQTLSDLIREFKEVGNVDSLSPEEKARLDEAGLKYSLNVGYHAYSSGSFVSYEFDIFMDTGGAHPNNLYKTLVFNLSGNTVSFGGLFSSSDYLNKISQLAHSQVEAQLRERAGEEALQTIIEEGLAGREENFENFVVDSDRIRIFIPPYQVAAYAAGSFEVQVPLSDVRDILKPEIK